MGEIRQEKSGFAAWTDRHAELWKFMKFLLAGGGSNVVELAVHMLLLNTVFAALTAEPVTAYFLNLIGITSKGYLYTYMVSTTVGYTIAFILNRKITFKADANPAVSMVLYAVMVLFTIFANGWIGDDNLGGRKRSDRESVRHGNQGDRNADPDALDVSV